jgi:O-antigen/teichoic acid export membrane protein
LMGSFVAVSGIYIFSTLIGSAGYVARMNWIFIIAFVINISINLLLIPQYKALGAAVSTLTTQFFVLITLIFLTKKLDILRGPLFWVLKIVGFAVAVLGLSFLVKNSGMAQSWYVLMAIAAAASGLLAAAMGFLNYKKIFP